LIERLRKVKGLANTFYFDRPPAAAEAGNLGRVSGAVRGAKPRATIYALFRAVLA
jgi:hypothetical protein